MGYAGSPRRIPRELFAMDAMCGRPWNEQSSMIQGSKTTLNDSRCPISRTTVLFSIPFNLFIFIVGAVLRPDRRHLRGDPDAYRGCARWRPRIKPRSGVLAFGAGEGPEYLF